MDELVEIEVDEVLKVTSKAMMFKSEDLDVDEQWVPLSVCDWDRSQVEPEVGSSGTLFVQEWFAKKEGLI